MPDDVKTFSGSLVLDLRIWWRHVHTLYTTSSNQGLWECVRRRHFNIRTLIKWTVSLAVFQPLSIAKTSVFHRRPRFYRWKNHSVKVHARVNSLRDSASFRLCLPGRGFQSKRFHDPETASKTTLREPANFAPDRSKIDAVSPFTRPMKPYHFKNAPLLKAFSKRPGSDNELEPVPCKRKV